MACLKTGIPAVKEVKLTVVAGARERFIFSESQRVEGAKVLSDFGLNEDSVLAALLIDSKNFCGDGSHFASLSTSDFAGDATRLQRFRPTERRQRRRVNSGYSPLSPIKSSLFSKRRPPSIFSVPAGRIAQAGLFNR